MGSLAHTGCKTSRFRSPDSGGSTSGRRRRQWRRRGTCFKATLHGTATLLLYARTDLLGCSWNKRNLKVPDCLVVAAGNGAARTPNAATRARKTSRLGGGGDGGRSMGVRPGGCTSAWRAVGRRSACKSFGYPHHLHFHSRFRVLRGLLSPRGERRELHVRSDAVLVLNRLCWFGGPMSQSQSP